VDRTRWSAARKYTHPGPAWTNGCARSCAGNHDRRGLPLFFQRLGGMFISPTPPIVSPVQRGHGVHRRLLPPTLAIVLGDARNGLDRLRIHAQWRSLPTLRAGPSPWCSAAEQMGRLGYDAAVVEPSRGGSLVSRARLKCVGPDVSSRSAALARRTTSGTLTPHAV